VELAEALVSSLEGVFGAELGVVLAPNKGIRLDKLPDALCEVVPKSKPPRVSPAPLLVDQRITLGRFVKFLDNRE
jgi:hypothetical protein